MQQTSDDDWWKVMMMMMRFLLLLPAFFGICIFIYFLFAARFEFLALLVPHNNGRQRQERLRVYHDWRM
jgi:hypothetical protein